MADRNICFEKNFSIVFFREEERGNCIRGFQLVFRKAWHFYINNRNLLKLRNTDVEYRSNRTCGRNSSSAGQYSKVFWMPDWCMCLYWLYPAKLKGYSSNWIHAQSEELCTRTSHLIWITIESFQIVLKP